MAYSATKDQFPNASARTDTFATKARAVTPHDTNDLDPYAKAIVVTGVGNLVILPLKNADGTTITFTGCPVGFIPPYGVRRVLATGTTASVATLDD